VTAASFRWPVRVYYEDTDAAGIVYYANYLKFMERARTEWLRSRGYDQSDLVRSQGVLFVVSRLSVRYHLPARLDDELQVDVDVTRLGRAGFHMQQCVFDEDNTPLCDAEVRIACLDAARMRPCAIPSPLLTELRREN
jgi:acyl-CoA thioester hydrolase